MPEPKHLSPLLDGLEFGANVQTEGTRSTYLMRDPKTGTVYLLRIFHVPDSPKQMDALVYSGAVSDRAEALRYYTDQLIDLRRELETIREFGTYPGIHAQSGYQIDELPDDEGYAVYILTEYYPTLAQHLSMNAMTMLEALNLGIDLCDALFTLHESGYLVQTITPDNIVVTPQNRFALTDLSLAELDRLDFCTIAEEKLTGDSAPELYGLIPSFKQNSDLYSVGMILYYIFNGNHNPFVDEHNPPAAANKRRLDGETLPVPMYADYELSEILLKACAFDPKERYQGADEFKAELMSYMQRNPVTDALIVPPICAQPEDVVTEQAEEPAEPISFANADEMDDAFIAHLSPSQEQHEEEAPSPDMAGKPAEPEHGAKKKRPRGKIILTIAGVTAACAITAGALWYFLRPDTLPLAGLEAVCTSDQITVSLQMPETDSALSIVCSDAYGNTQRKEFTGSDVVFDALTPGTQYAITVETSERLRLTGTTSLNITTDTVASLGAISVTELTADSVTLQLTVSQPAPEEWTITCTSDGQAPMTHIFAGNSILITGLNSNTTYTCTFADAAGTPIRGETSVTFTTEPRVTLESFEVQEATADAVTLEWNYSGDRPSSWSIRCEGSDGTVHEQQVSGLTATFDGLSSDVEYTFTISTVGMEDSTIANLTVSTIDIQLSDLTAEPQDATTVAVSWTASGAPEGGLWNVTYSISDSDAEPVTVTTSETSVTLTDLLPQTRYSIEVTDADGNALSGTNTAFARTPTAERYTDNGCKSLYTALYLEPSQENWTILNLATLRTSFSANEGIAVAVEAIGGVQKSDEEVTLRAVIRNSDGTPLGETSRTAQWDDLWTKSVLVSGAPDTPQEAGTYTLELYIDGRLLTSAEFRVN